MCFIHKIFMRWKWEYNFCFVTVQFLIISANKKRGRFVRLEINQCQIRINVKLAQEWTYFCFSTEVIIFLNSRDFVSFEPVKKTKTDWKIVTEKWEIGLSSAITSSVTITDTKRPGSLTANLSLENCSNKFF